MDGRPMDYEDCQTLVEIQSDEGIVHGKLVVFASYTKERAPGFTLERVICFMTFFGGHAKTEDIITSPALDIFGFGVCSPWSLIYSCARTVLTSGTKTSWTTEHQMPYFRLTDTEQSSLI